MSKEIKVAFGNNKLSKRIAITNITSATNCPSDHLGLCPIAHECYAKRPENFRPAVLPSREEATVLWDGVTAEEFVESLLGLSTFKVGARKGTSKIDYLRFSEAGDIRTLDDLMKMERIAELLKEYGVDTYTYTHRTDLYAQWYQGDFELNNLVVNGSGFMWHNEFRVVTDETRDPALFLCPGKCGDKLNGGCTKCMEAHGEVTQVMFH